MHYNGRKLTYVHEDRKQKLTDERRCEEEQELETSLRKLTLPVLKVAPLIQRTPIQRAISQSL